MQQTGKTTFAGLLTVLLAACSFDGSALETRTPCSADEDCVSGVCFEGSCTPRELLVDAVEVDADAMNDTGDGLDDAQRDTDGDTGVGDVQPDAADADAEDIDTTDAETDVDDGDTEPRDANDAEDSDTADAETDVVTECEPGVERCAGPQVIARCDNDGDGETLRECPGARYCDDETVNCLDQVCEPLSTQCLVGEEAYETCDVRGAGYLTSFPCQLDEVCDAGACVPERCEPNTSRCDNDDVVVCDARGSSESVFDACPFGCFEGACRDSRCGDGILDPENDETCDDGNEIACDGCTTCSVQRTLDLSNVETTLGAGWEPGESDFTLEAWVNLRGNGTIMGFGAADDTDSVTLEIDAGFLVFSYQLGEGQDVNVRTPERLTTGWHHIAALRFDQDSAALFVDGILVNATINNFEFTSVDGDGTIWVGSDGDTNTVNGNIDAVRISSIARYTTSFTPTLRPTADDSTIALYEFDATSIDAAGVDSSGNGRDLILVDAGLDIDSCRASPPNARFCGDGNVAPWERCDGGESCTPECQPDVGCDGVVGPGDRCYSFVDEAVNWTSARDGCRSLGGELITINTELESAWAGAVFGALEARWIGINDRDDEGEFTWVSGDDGEFRAWNTGEPNNSLFREDCVELLMRGNEGTARWNDSNCANDRQYICEFE